MRDDDWYDQPDEFPLEINHEFRWNDQRMKLITWFHVEYESSEESLWPLDKRNTQVLVWDGDWKPFDHNTLTPENEEQYYDAVVDLTVQRFEDAGGTIWKRRVK